MRTAARLSLYGLGALAALLLVLAGALLVMGNTDAGRRGIERLTARLTAGEVTLAGLGGRFPSHLTLRQLRLSDARGTWLEADDVRLDWRPAALLRRVIAIKAARAARLVVSRAPVSQSTGGGGSSLPHIDIGDLDIARLQLGAALAGTPTELTVRGNARLRSLTNMSLTLAAVRAGGEGTYALELSFDTRRMDGLLTLQEPAGGPLAHLAGIPALGALHARLALNGPRDAESLDLHADAGDMQLGAQGTLDLPRRSGDVAYAFSTPAMQPRADLGWQSLQVAGRWLGPLARSQTTARLNASALTLPGGVRLDELLAGVDARNGQLQFNAGATGLQLPEPGRELLRQAPVTLEGSLRLDQAAWPFTLKAAHPLFQLQAQGQAHAGELLVDVTLALTDLAPLAASRLPGIRGAADLTTHLAQHGGAYELQAAIKGRSLALADVAGALLGPAPQVQLRAQLADGLLRLQQLQLTGAGISAQVTGETRTGAAAKGLLPKPALQASGQLALTNLALLAPQLAGRLAFNGKASGAFDDFELQGSLSGLLGSREVTPGPLSGSVRARGLPRRVDADLTLKGMLDQSALQLDIAAQRDPTGTLHAGIRHGSWKSLQLAGELWLPPDPRQLHGSMALQIPHLQDLQRVIGTDLAGSLDARASIQAAGAGGPAQPALHLQLAARDIVTAGFSGSASLSANGSLRQLALNLAAQSPDIAGQPATVAAEGVLDAEGGTLALSGLTASVHGVPLRQLGEARLAFRPEARVAGLKLTAAGATLEVDGTVQPRLALTANLADVTPALLNALWPGVLAGGSAQLKASLSGAPGAPDGRIELAARGVRAAGATWSLLPAVDADATVQLAGGLAQLAGEVRAGRGSRVSVRGQLPLRPEAALDVKLTGRVDAALVNPVLEAHGRQVTGQLDLDAALTGTLAAPALDGAASLSQGTLHDYRNGIDLTQIAGKLRAAGQELEISSLTARAGPGTLDITGTVGVLKPAMPVALRLVAQDAQPLNSTLVSSHLNADLTLGGDLRQGMDFKGQVHVTRALINIPNSFPPNVAVLDVRRPGEAPPPPPAAGTPIRLEVTVQAPHQVLVKGRGLDAELGGTLHVNGTADAPVVSGGFSLQRGQFTLGGSRLNFTEGHVRFNGTGLQGGIDPSLDFTAENQTADATSRVHITGFASAPRFELTSVPQLPQDEILARLLFGTSASQLTALQAAQIGVALTTLTGIGGGGLNPLAAIQKRLGLDRLSVGSNETTTATGATQNQGATIEAGRYLTDRIFADVRQNTDGTTQLKVSVDLTKRLKLQTQLGTGTAPVQGTTPDNDPGSSVGLSYRFEY